MDWDPSPKKDILVMTIRFPQFALQIPLTLILLSVIVEQFPNKFFMARHVLAVVRLYWHVSLVLIPPFATVVIKVRLLKFLPAKHVIYPPLKCVK